MDITLGMAGAIFGIMLGVVGGAVGTYFGVQRAESRQQRTFLLKCAALAWFAVVAMVLLLLLVIPAPYHVLVWVPYAIGLTAAIHFVNRRVAQLKPSNGGPGDN